MAAEAEKLYNGAAAYDIYSVQAQVARPQPKPRLPEERPVRRETVRRKAHTQIAPFALVGILMVACLMVLVVFGYVQLYEASSQVSSLEAELRQLNMEQFQLQSKYEGRIDLNQIQERAGELGLKVPMEEQIVYLNLAGTDRAELYHQQHSSVLSEVVSALEQSVSSMIEYLNRKAA